MEREREDKLEKGTVSKSSKQLMNHQKDTSMLYILPQIDCFYFRTLITINQTQNGYIVSQPRNIFLLSRNLRKILSSLKTKTTPNMFQ